MIVYVLIGGMKGTTWVQIIKAVLLIGGAAVMTVWVLADLRLQLLDTLLGERGVGIGHRPRDAILAPGLQYGDRTSQINFSRSRWRWCSARQACRTC